MDNSAPDFIPDDKFKPDNESQAAPDFIPDNQFKPDEQSIASSSNAPDFIPDSEFKPDDETQNGQIGHHVLSDIEAFGRGITGGLSDVLADKMRQGASAVGVPDEYLHYIAPSKEDLARNQENTTESGAVELLGNAALMSRLPMIGSKAVGTALQMMALTGMNEASKEMLGHADPASVVAKRIAADGFIGFIGGHAIQKLEPLALKGLDSIKLGNVMRGFLTGVGHAAEHSGEKIVPLSESTLSSIEKEGLSPISFKVGQRFQQHFPRIATSAITGLLTHSFGEAAGSGLFESFLEPILAPVTNKISREYVAPAFLKAASANATKNLGQLLNHATSAAKGGKAITNAIDSIFKVGGDKVINDFFPVEERYRRKLEDFMEQGGPDKIINDEAQQQNSSQNFAEGGSVNLAQPNENIVSTLYPEQSMLMSAAKLRVGNYLNSQRPIQKPTLPFDTDHKSPQDKREYHKVLDMAIKPLSILKRVKNGELTPKDMKHFTSMYPELHDHLSKEMTKRITNIQANGDKKPSHKVRQSLSLFLGSNLDSTLTPMNIQAAQSVFQMQKSQRQQQISSKASSSLKKLGENSMLPGDARTKALNKT